MQSHCDNNPTCAETLPCFEKDIDCIQTSPLFESVEKDALIAMLGCINAQEKRCGKGDFVLRNGDITTKMGLVLQGSISVQRTDYWGNRAMMGIFGAGETFAEVYASTPGLVLDIDIVALEDTRILIMDVGRVTTMCPNSCTFHTQLIRNLLASVSKRNHSLVRKIDHLSKRTTRMKLLSYLSDCAKNAQSNEFRIDFDRQSLADFLAVDRSAMCAELSRMRKDGIVDYKKNDFKLLDYSATLN